MSRKSRFIVFMVLLAMVVAACQPAPADEPAAPAVPDAPAAPEFAGTITIGAAVSETGRYAQQGGDVRKGYGLWLDWVNDEYGGIKVGDDRYKVEIIFYDDESDSDTAVSLTEKLISEDEVDFLLGPYSSGLTMSTSAIAEQHGIIFVEANGASESIFSRGFENLFAVLTPANFYTKAAIETLAANGVKTMVIAHEDAAFATSVLAGAVVWAEENGIEVLGIETYPVDATAVEFDPIVTKFKALNPDAYVGGGHLNDAIAFVQSAASLGFCPKAMVLTAGPNFAAFADELGDAANYIVGPTQWAASMGWNGEYLGSPADYEARYLDKWGESPSYQAAESTAAGLALQAAIEAAGSLETDAVRSALRALDITTFYGPVQFDGAGINIAKPMAAGQVIDGKFTIVAPSEAAVTDFQFPKPCDS